MNKNKQAFTLVELIVVITIIAILWTIAFISLHWYSKSSRDSVRISDVSSMKTSLELFQLNSWKYPLPDNGAEVSYSWDLLWTQWYFWENVVSQLSRNFNKIPKDPLTDREYIYSVSNNKNEYEILALLEWEVALNSTQKANAATLEVIPRIDWQYNWVFVKTPSYIVPTPSIINAEVSWANLILDNTNIKSQIISWWDNIPNYGNINYSTWNLSWLELSAAPTITKDSSETDKLAVINAIQAAYTWANLWDDKITDILSKTTDEDKLVLVDYLVLNKPAPVKQTETIPEIPPVLLLHADGDLSNSKHPYTTHGNPQILSNGWKFDWAMSFDWVDDYISIPDHTDFNFWAGDFTIDFWVKLNDITNTQYILNFNNSISPNDNRYFIQHSNILWWMFYITDNNLNVVTLIENNITTNINEWNHITIIRDNVWYKLFKNGKLIVNNNNTDYVQPTWDGDFEIGRTTSTAYLNGQIDELRISKWLARWNFDMWFNAVGYVGNGNQTQDITWVWFQPDLTWVKDRDWVYNHALFDSLRWNYNIIFSDLSNAEGTSDWWVLLPDGFTVGTNWPWNDLSHKHISWNWKEWPEYGLDIISYTWDWVQWRKINHSLWKVPKFILVKNLTTAWYDWIAYHEDIAYITDWYNKDYLNLNQDYAYLTNSNAWNSKAPTDTDITLGIMNSINGLDNQYIAYAFSEIPWYSKFGSYIGNGIIDGPEIDLWFNPAFVLVKPVEIWNWYIADTTRWISTWNDPYLSPNLSTAEGTWANWINLINNWFKIVRDETWGVNKSWVNYIYVAFSNGVAETFTPATSPYTTDANTNLLLHFDWDASSSKHNLTFTWWILVDSATAKNTSFNWSYYFDWVDDYIEIPDSEDWNFGSEDFTVDIWVNPTALSSWWPVINAWLNGNNEGQATFAIIQDNLGNYRVLIKKLGSTYIFYDTIIPLSVWEWQHLALVRDWTNLYFFKNGVKEVLATDLNNDMLDNYTGNLKIWYSTDTLGAPIYYWNGNIDELRISKWVARWTENFVPDTSPY